MTVAFLAIRNSTHTVRWANSLAERGHDITVISSQTGGDPLHEAVREHTLSIPAPLGYFLNVFELRTLLRRLQPDLLHAHFASGYGTLGRLSGYHPYLLSVWGSDVYEFPTRSPLHRRLLESNLQASDHVCSTSEVMVEQTRSVCEDVGPITVTAFGVDIQTFTPEPDGTDEQDVIRVGTVKTLAEKYGIDVFIDAAATVRDALQDAETRREERLRFLIVGGGSQKGELKQLVRDRRLDDITIFTGQVPNEEVPRYLNSLDIYVAASRSESFGVAILEASACACPVVVSDVGGLPEVVDNERTGIVVPREDPVSTAEAILRLIRDPQLRASMGEAGRSRVQDRYSWESCVDRMETVYKNVTTQSGS